MIIQEEKPLEISETKIVFMKEDIIEISFRMENLSLRYHSDLPLVLKNISINIPNPQRLGIIGRTGAGKSSVIEAIMRIVEPEEGSIYEIDGEDALSLGLHSLRKRISIISQSSFLMKGSLRNNLDPFCERQDS